MFHTFKNHPNKISVRLTSVKMTGIDYDAEKVTIQLQVGESHYRLEYENRALANRDFDELNRRI